MQCLLKLMEYLFPSGYFFNQCFFIPLCHLLFFFIFFFFLKKPCFVLFMHPDVYSQNYGLITSSLFLKISVFLSILSAGAQR